MTSPAPWPARGAWRAAGKVAFWLFLAKGLLWLLLPGALAWFGWWAP